MSEKIEIRENEAIAKKEDMQKREKILQVKDLTISFRTANGKVHAVRDISFSVRRGETLAIVGESGSGKSVTSKAILGISAVNAMHESGEILYRDKDLLQIDEEEFHELRGSRISMVFQDPLSALNPIVRTGKQITEAIILNNKTDREAARKNLDQLYDSLERELHSAADKNKEYDRNDVDNNFRKFKEVQQKQIDLGINYGKHVNRATEAYRVVNLLIADISKHIQRNIKQGMNKISKNLHAAKGEYLLSEADIKEFEDYYEKYKQEQHNKHLMQGLEKTAEKLGKYLSQKEPDFFLEAYRKLYVDKESSETGSSKRTADEEVRKTMRSQFLEPFEKQVAEAIKISSEKATLARDEARKLVKQERDVFTQKPLDSNLCKEKIKVLSDKVEAAINPLDINKDSVLHTFRNTMNNNLERYTEGIKKNKREEKRYAKSKAKFDKVAAKGKNPGWKVIPKDLLDLDWAQDKVVEALDRILARLDRLDMLYKNVDYREKAAKLIKHTAKLASRAANIVTNVMAEERAVNLMREVGIPEPELRFHQFPFELSGGMRQRIVIAIALSANPDLLICDEPTTALDVTIQAQILELINNLKKERDLSIIFITHDLGVVANMADRIAVMYAGKIVEIGEVDEVFYEPAHPYTWALLSSMPDLETKEKLTAIPGTPPNMLMPPKGDAFAARNRYAMKIDFERQPPMFKISDTHYAATWLLAPGAPKVELPPIVMERIERMKRREAESEARI